MELTPDVIDYLMRSVSQEYQEELRKDLNLSQPTVSSNLIEEFRDVLIESNTDSQITCWGD